MSKTDTLEICRKYLFDNPKEKLPLQINERLIRIRAAFVHWTEFPMKGDIEIRDFIMDEYDLSKSQAYDDLGIIKVLLGNVKNAGKEWQRYTVIEMIKLAFDMAKTKQDSKAMILAADKLGKYTQLHLPDVDPIPYDDIVPQPFEPTSDPSAVGLKPVNNLKERIQALREKYSADIDENVTDVEFVEINPEDEEI